MANSAIKFLGVFLLGIIATLLIFQILPPVENFWKSVFGLLSIIASAFFGGLFAGVWTNHFESNRRIHDKRHDKYYEHKNTIVQIEHELIPLRLNTSRNLEALSDAIINTNPTNIRFILRFYKLLLSAGLSQKVVTLEIINKYSQLYSAIEIFNSDIEYVQGIIYMVQQNAKEGRVDESLNVAYKQFLPHLKQECEDIDQKTLELLTLSQLALNKDDSDIKKIYIKNGKEIKYHFTRREVETKNSQIREEEDYASHPDEQRPQFISPFLDLKRVIIAPVPNAS